MDEEEKIICEALEGLYFKAELGVWERSGDIKRDLAEMRLYRIIINNRLRKLKQLEALFEVMINEQNR